MAEKTNLPVDDLNKILTNMLNYERVLRKLSNSIKHTATREKLKEFADVKNKEAETLMKVIKDMGGQIETNERVTDQEAIDWVSKPLPDPNDMDAVLAKLIKAEQNIIKDYNDLFSQEEIEQDHQNMLEKHKQEAEANLDYFQNARESG